MAEILYSSLYKIEIKKPSKRSQKEGFFVSIVVSKMAHSKVQQTNVNLDFRMLISVQEYEKLIERSKKLSLYEEKYAGQLKEEVRTPVSEKTNFINDHSANNQTGLGNSDLIADVVQPSTEIEQNLPVLYDEPTSAPPSSSVILLHKSKQSSEIADQALINLLPNKFKSRGQKLLVGLLKFSDTITWSDSGLVTIEHDSIPNSNIFDIFAKLFKYTKQTENISGLSEVITIIATLGLGYLINKRYLTGLRRQHKILNENSLLEDTRNLKYWWYLGP